MWEEYGSLLAFRRSKTNAAATNFGAICGPIRLGLASPISEAQSTHPDVLSFDVRVGSQRDAALGDWLWIGVPLVNQGNTTRTQHP